ncbi:hypothetical protein C8Q78DRAFT_627194 [Trametes maxima]|nr:hypothetical protein C8Q78DRAFT_627194 [Trametes maxima]
MSCSRTSSTSVSWLYRAPPARLVHDVWDGSDMWPRSADKREQFGQKAENTSLINCVPQIVGNDASRVGRLKLFGATGVLTAPCNSHWGSALLRRLRAPLAAHWRSWPLRQGIAIASRVQPRTLVRNATLLMGIGMRTGSGAGSGERCRSRCSTAVGMHMCGRPALDSPALTCAGGYPPAAAVLGLQGSVISRRFICQRLHLHSSDASWCIAHLASYGSIAAPDDSRPGAGPAATRGRWLL